MTQRYVVVDLETTGNAVKKGDKIIQFAAVVIENDRIVDTYSTLINPQQPISPFIEELTGIKEEDVKDAPLFEEVAPTINSLLRHSTFVAHNVLFDLPFLQDQLQEAGFEGFFGSTIDTVELAKIMRPGATSYKLSHLALDEGYEHDRPHQADSDAYVTAELFLLFKREMAELPLVTLKQLNKLSFSLKSEISDLLSQILQARMAQSPKHHPGLAINKGIAFNKPVSEDAPKQDVSQHYPVSKEEKMEMLSKAFSRFEQRSDQLLMMDQVYKTLTEGQISLIEAGTGLGKTLGYLLPAAYFSAQRQQSVMISTYTIDLQNQLLHKELDNLKKMIPFSVKSAVLKGRANYLSLAKFDRALRARDDHYDSALTKMQILVWLLKTTTGDKDELNLTSGGELFWEKLHCSPGLASEHTSSWEAYDFYERALMAAGNADLIITNHSYLMSDVFGKKNPLLKSRTLIVDEAHHLESAALKYLGSSIDYVSMKMLTNKLGQLGQNQLLCKLEKMVSGIDACYKQKIGDVDFLLQEAIFEWEQFFTLLSKICQEESEKQGFKQALPLGLLLEGTHQSQPLYMLAERLAEHFKRIASALKEMVQLVVQKGHPGKTQLFYLNDIEDIASSLREYAGLLQEFFLRNKEDILYWAEWTRNSPSQYVYLYSQPITGGSEMWSNYFSQLQSAVLTSSTLTIKGSFEYMKKKLGFDGQSIETAIYPSPFDYKNKVRLLVAEDIPEVSNVAMDEYASHIADYIEQAAIATKGRMLVLFTSHEMLKATHEYVRNKEELMDFNILSQGISSKSKTRLIKYFQNYDKSILLGTASFWDGLDLPGETLECLMVVRLPFSPPNDPVTEARLRKIKEQGENPFTAYSLPEAIVRFRQGFGRLIRTAEDKGVCIICDKRIVSAYYGQDFLQSIPAVQTDRVVAGDLQMKIKDWFKGQEK
ncbi:ATP-dependent DNA helicase DinG [Bacillus testis]|uniref:ATP-dependent DNA helicase DinG n=1 Tax=Bacillus testis TaxID=1622072 RepID=UPI00067EB703|nr:ATP-dependent DNA helicase DinG [Bacillus testis]